MASTYNAASLNKFALNSQASTTGEIRTGDIDAGNSEWSVELTDDETTPQQEPFFVAARMTGPIVLEDYDALFTDTMNNGNTAVKTMTNNGTLYVQFVLEGGTITAGDNSTQWFEVKPHVRPIGDVSSDTELLKGEISFNFTDFDGPPRI